MLSYTVTSDIKLAVPRPVLDGPKLFKLLNSDRKFFGYYLPWVKFTKTATDEIKFLQSTNKHLGTGDSLNLIIWFKEQIAGMISFNHFEKSRNSADIGYWLGKDFQGKGIITQAVKGLCDLGFQDYDLNRIIIVAAIDNKPSNAVAQHTGFHLEGTLRQNEPLDDGFHDENIYSFLKDEWK